MKELDTQFAGRGEVRGYTFTQVNQSPHAYIYKKQDDTTTRYEVFERKENVNPEWGINQVSFPSSKAFGIWAWQYNTYEEARQKFDELNKRAVNE